jgi:DNA-binding response OmpR family regulator
VRPFVLLIDDDESFRESIASAFELRGIAVDVAGTWDEGLALFQACAHELVIADYNLPDSKNGLMLLVEAKLHRPASKLILISGVLSDRAAEILDGSTLIDGYYPKTGDVVEPLLKAAAEAIPRAESPTDWAGVAGAFLSTKQLDRAEFEEMDKALRAEMGG